MRVIEGAIPTLLILMIIEDMAYTIRCPLCKHWQFFFSLDNKRNSYNSNGFYCWDTSGCSNILPNILCAAGNHSTNAFIQGDLDAQEQNRMKKLNSNLLILQNTAMLQKQRMAFPTHKSLQRLLH